MNDNPNFLLFKDPPPLNLIHSYAVNKSTDSCKLPAKRDGNLNPIIGIGSLYKCPECGQNYVLTEDVSGWNFLSYWKSISERKARKILAKAQK